MESSLSKKLKNAYVQSLLLRIPNQQSSYVDAFKKTHQHPYSRPSSSRSSRSPSTIRLSGPATPGSPVHETVTDRYITNGTFRDLNSLGLHCDSEGASINKLLSSPTRDDLSQELQRLNRSVTSVTTLASQTPIRLSRRQKRLLREVYREQLNIDLAKIDMNTRDHATKVVRKTQARKEYEAKIRQLRNPRPNSQ